MAEPRDAPWPEIRRTYETSLLGDASLASLFGFASKTTIKRRRIAEGWKRDEAAIRAAQAAEAVAVVNAEQGVPRVPPEPAGGTPGAHGESEQFQRPAPRSDVGVPPEMGRTSSPSGQSVAHTREAQPKASIAEQLHEEAVAARVRQLRLGRALQELAELGIEALKGVLRGPRNGETIDPETGLYPEGTPYARAIISLRALNPDKDSVSTIIKAVGEAAQKGVDIERKSLHMDEAAPDGAGPAEHPDGIPSDTEFVALYAHDLDALEKLADVTRDISRRGVAARPAAGPTIDGQAERIK